jgi:hypothetical protein
LLALVGIGHRFEVRDDRGQQTRTHHSYDDLHAVYSLYEKPHPYAPSPHLVQSGLGRRGTGTTSKGDYAPNLLRTSDSDSGEETFLDTPVLELVLGSSLGTLVVVHHFRRELPRDQQELWEQAAQKYQEESHAHSSAVVGLMYL